MAISLDSLPFRNSLTWPSHWRRSIYKIEQMHDWRTFRILYVVYPHNPEYRHSLSRLIAPFLDPIEFDTVEDVDQWARVLARISE